MVRSSPVAPRPVVPSTAPPAAGEPAAPAVGERPPGRGRTSLVARLALTITALVVFAVAIPSTLAVFTQSGELYVRALDNALGRGQLAAIAAGDAITNRDLGTLDRVAASLVSEHNRVSAAVIVDAGGNPLARSALDTVSVPAERFPVPPTVIVENARRDGVDLILVTSPIVLDGMPWGALRQVIDVGSLKAAEMQLVYQILGVSLGLVVLGIACAALIARSVARPLRRLAAAVGEVARGNLDCRADVHSRDELGALAEAFEDMTIQLRASNKELREQSAALEQQVVERTAELELARDAALGAARAKSEFLANMSHEIRTPLNGLLGFLTLLGDTELEHHQREYLDVARSSSEALLALLNDILDLSKIDAGKLSLENIEFDRDDLLEAVSCLFAPIAQAKGVEFLLNVDPGCPVRLRSDPTRLRQVLSNLLGNAVKFTAKGEVELKVRAMRRNGARCFLHFEVRDTGEGIPRDRLSQLFNAFQQADGSTSRRFGGTGLGLAIVKRIVTQMGGQTKVETEVGRGSRFFVSVPVEVVASPIRDRRVAAAIGTPTIVIDDHPARGQLLIQQLHGMGADAEIAPGIEAVLPRLRALGASGTAVTVFVDDALAQSVGGVATELAPGVRCFVLRPASKSNDPLPDGFVGSLVKPIRRAVLVRTMSTSPTPVVSTARPTERSTEREGAVDRAPPPSAGADAAAPTSALAGRRVLVAEDNPVNRRLMAALLGKLALDVTLAVDGSQAVEAWAGGGFEAILMDMQMPVMDGLQAAEEIRRREAGTARVPIIALTANALAGDRERCIAAGMDDYLTKPVRAPQLLETLGQWLRVGAVTAAETS